ncbi:helix-turn-helix transcriptional regulator [Sphingobacterium spiritivorum]|nr:helix-turn-helix transcriptional regulator [Sphingobacterium spiritivorum]QQT34056.1 helix-turn-helix transcriptional regulator [Sphingobacterium spiritivorum]WQD34885.1 helix-turn-helix transcriptional regulator [Sphingobacterium spiritivorum]SUI98615.1 DNA-binding transcriptional regulator AraC [Sphingobacterium spiritivorum]
MKKLLLNITYTLTPQWLQQFSDQIGTRLIDNKIILFSREIAEGRIYFIELMPGLSVMLRDMIVHQPIHFSRKAKEDDLVFVYYDLSENISTHIVNGVGHMVGLNSPFDMGIVDSSVESSYIPILGERVYSLCLLVSKKLLIKLFKNHIQNNNKNVYFDPERNTLLFYGHIDSRSKLLLHQLKKKSYTDPSFELFFKSTSYRLFGLLIEGFSKISYPSFKLSDIEIKGILATQEYILTQLWVKFPGVSNLARMAGMSESKYKLAFRRVFNDTPNNFFLTEKLFLAKRLLTSGDYNSVLEIAYELGYSKSSYFSAVYRSKFGVLPGSVLVRKKSS